MISETIYDDLIASLHESFVDITMILKSLGNEKRMRILLRLLRGPQSYGSIVFSLDLKKTAVSNHLSQLLKTNLIQKEDYGRYSISEDGIEFIKAIEKAYQMSPTRQIKKFEDLQSRGVTDSFRKRFNT
ncbi:MAG: ArsR family transcriptional regulator [Promethearchaeota archaeon]|jgi:DNA-binding transcriptional ArsR family regulator